MSNFSPEWLRLREAADLRARNRTLAEKLAAYFAGRDEVTIYDLGSGLGSNLRGTYAALPKRQRWVLVDYDPVLLAAAGGEIARWAGSARATPGGVETVRDEHSIEIEFKQHDLAADPAPWGEAVPDLVTAAALFDLVSESWIARFTTALADGRIPFYTVLTHNREVSWQPPHASDAQMIAAFERHFGSDKGFGPSVGGAASQMLSEKLRAARYEVMRAPSPWVLGEGDRALIAELAAGWAKAVRETGTVQESVILDWQRARARAIACTVGHEDLLALPR
jgi:hypothetical protein